MVLSLVVLASPLLADASNKNIDQTPTSQASGSSGIGYQGWGLRVGMTDDSDQVVGGAHFNMGEVVDHLRLQPDIQLGSGDDHTTIYGTVPLYWRFDTATRMTPYAGGGLALGYVEVDLPPGANGDDSEFELGARATGGLEWPRGAGQAFFVELSLGFGDVHDATVMAAWSF